MIHPIPTIALSSKFCPDCKCLCPNTALGQHYLNAEWLKVLCDCQGLPVDVQLELFEVPA